VTLEQVKRAVCLLNHRLAASGEAASKDVLLLLTSIVHRSQSTLSSTDVASLKEYIFRQSAPVMDLCLSSTLSNVVREGRFLSII
jgi:hypothetical protein